ncbi:MAG: hypothetical protein ACREAU_06090 [Nitrosopumilaceae archaeon]
MVLLTFVTVAFAFDLSTFGNLDVLNRVGNGDVGRVIRTYDKTMTVLGYPNNPGNFPGRMNHLYGHSQVMQQKFQQRGMTYEATPEVVRDVQEVERYLNW